MSVRAGTTLAGPDQKGQIMPRIVRNHTIHNLEDAYIDLRDRLAEADPASLADSPAQGCCGCGTPMADIRSDGEGYCWPCADRLSVNNYTVLPSRDR